MPGNGVSGQYGDVKIGSTQISEVSKWSYNPKVTIHAYSSNKTGGYKKKVAGIKDGTGSIEGIYDPANPIMATIDIGTAVTLKLYLTATVFYSVPAIISSLKLDVDIDTGDFVKYSSDFEATGAWTNPLAGLRVANPGAEDKSMDANPHAVVRNHTEAAPTVPRQGPQPTPKLTDSLLSMDDVAEMVAAQIAMSQEALIAQLGPIISSAASEAATAAIAAWNDPRRDSPDNRQDASRTTQASRRTGNPA
jgi:hypothetical protein